MIKGSTVSERVRALVPSVVRGRLLEIESDGTLIVAAGDLDGERHFCDYLWVDRSGSAPLVAGCQVLFVPPSAEGERGCVLGVVGRFVKVTSEGNLQEARSNSVPRSIHEREIEIAADEKVTLKCGESSIVLSGDGTIVIRGNRVVSRSKGVNRIKGAAVQIN